MKRLKKFLIYLVVFIMIILIGGYYWISIKWKENISEQEFEQFASEIEKSPKIPEVAYSIFKKIYKYDEKTSTWDMIFKRIFNPNKVIGCGCMDANYPFERETINRVSLALKLDKTVGPKKFIDFFLENVTYSNNKRGFVQASKIFFNKEAVELTDREIASLILMTKASTHYDFRRNPELVNEEINNILNK